jgi:hypothetical protein
MSGVRRCGGFRGAFLGPEAILLVRRLRLCVSTKIFAPPPAETLTFLNSATKEDIVAWNGEFKLGIGVAKAASIVAHRDECGGFNKIEDVRCKGVSDSPWRFWPAGSEYEERGGFSSICDG